MALEESLLALLQQQQSRPPQLNTGLLAPGQQGIKDVFTNPDQAQVNALIGGIAGAVNPRGRDPALMGLVGAAQGFQGQRQREFQGRIESEKLRQESLRNQLSGALGIANLGVSQSNLRLAQTKDTRASHTLRDVSETPEGIIGTDVTGVRVFKSNPRMTTAEFKRQEDTRQKALESSLGASDTQFARADTLRDEVTAASKDFVTIGNSYSRIVAVAKDPSPAGDLALIFNYMKMLDPNSVVRESEFATAQNTGSVPENIWNTYNRVLNGQKLGKTRQDFLKKSKALFDSQKGRNDAAVERIVSVGEQFGVPRTQILGREPVAPAPTSSRFTITEVQ